ncbi:MAG: DsbA family protein [Phototrophicaceae bacterium]
MDIQENETVTESAKSQSEQIIKATTIAGVFLILGLMLGAWGYSLLVINQRAVIAEVVGTQIAGQEARIANQVIGEIFSNVQGGQPQAQAQEPGAGARVEVSVDDDPAIGSLDAPVTMIEFSDFRCPYCGRFAIDTLEPLLEAYGEYVYFVYRDFAILGPESINAAIASECADDQEQFWTYHDLLFANQANLNRATYISLAEDLNLDMDTFTGCIDNETHLEEVQADSSTVQQLGATGTPTFFINGRFVSGAQPFEVFARIIEEELEAVGVEVE